MRGGVVREHAAAGALADCRGLSRAGAGFRAPRAAEFATRISSPGVKKSSSPAHESLMIGVPQAAASNRRTLGE